MHKKYTLPCDTPDTTGLEVDFVPFTTAHCDLFLRTSSIQFIMFLWTPYYFSKFEWHSVERLVKIQGEDVYQFLIVNGWGSIIDDIN